MRASGPLAAALERLRARPAAPEPLDRPVPLAELPTPALVLDADALDRNLVRMADFLGSHGKGFRPHAKTHKCPELARLQIAAGAAGICTAKVSEAAAMVYAGIPRVLVTSPVVSADRASLLAALAAEAGQLDVVVDSELGLDVLSAAAAGGAGELGVVVDVDVAMGRTGNRDGDAILRLAERAAATPGLAYRGVQHYAGHVMHVKGHGERRDRSLKLWERVTGIVGRLTDAGLAPGIVTGGGTGTYDIDCAVPVITDLQVGSYVFMDQEYRLIGGREGEWFDDFEVSLTVLATAISQPTGAAVTVDAGYKSFASDSVNPEPLDVPDTEFRFAGDEHGVLLLRAPTQEPLLGRRARFVTPHCDPTVNLYDWYWVCRDGLVTEVWPITARGCAW